MRPALSPPISTSKKTLLVTLAPFFYSNSQTQRETQRVSRCDLSIGLRLGVVSQPFE